MARTKTICDPSGDHAPSSSPRHVPEHCQSGSRPVCLEIEHVEGGCGLGPAGQEELGAIGIPVGMTVLAGHVERHLVVLGPVRGG